MYDAGGQLLSGSLMDYLLPTSQDIPNIETVITEEAPSPLNPLGVKGAGEGAILATGAALGNAVAKRPIVLRGTGQHHAPQPGQHPPLDCGCDRIAVTQGSVSFQMVYLHG